MEGKESKKGSMKKEITFMDVLKIIGVIAVFIPLMTGILQYRQSVRQEQDKNFRDIIEKLSLEKTEERLAAASSIGTFLNKGDKYYDEVVDILINRLSIEIDYNVLNAIRGSLEKIEIEEEEYRKIIDKLLGIERNIFVQKYALENWMNDAKKAFEESEKRSINRENLLKKYKLDTDKEMLENLKKDMNQKWNLYIKRKEDFDELNMHKQVISDFLSVFLGVTKSLPLEELVFFRNGMDRIVMVGVNLINAHIELSSFASSTILDTKFDRSTIDDTVFTLSNLKKSSFVDCKIMKSLFNQANLSNVDFSGSEFTDVFFTIADLEGTKFLGVKGLKPIYFYKAENVDKAVFEPVFKKELEETKITEDIFKDYINKKSGLSRIRREAILNTLKQKKSTEVPVK